MIEYLSIMGGSAIGWSRTIADIAVRIHSRFFTVFNRGMIRISPWILYIGAQVLL